MALLWVQPKPKTTREYTWPCNLSRPRNEHLTTTEGPGDGAGDCSAKGMEGLGPTSQPRALALCGGQAAGRRQSQQTYFIPFLRLSSNFLFATFSLPCSCFSLCWIVNGWGHGWSCPLPCNPQFLANTGTLVGSRVSRGVCGSRQPHDQQPHRAAAHLA